MKRIILITLFVCIGLSAFANKDSVLVDSMRTKQSGYLINKFSDNWDVCLAVGPNIFFGESCKHFDPIFDAMTFPWITANIMKWLTPAWGIGLGVEYSPCKALYYPNNLNTFSRPEVDQPYSKNPYYTVSKGHMLGAYIRTDCNIPSLFNGYRKGRVFQPVAYVGAGFLLPVGKMEYRPCGITFTAGIMFNFQITEHFHMGINLEGTLITDNIDGRYHSNETTDLTNLPFDANQKLGIDFVYHFSFVKKQNAVTGEVETVPWVPSVDSTYYEKVTIELSDAKDTVKQLEQVLVETYKADSIVNNRVRTIYASKDTNAPATAEQLAQEDSLLKELKMLRDSLLREIKATTMAKNEAQKAKADYEKREKTRIDTVVITENARIDTVVIKDSIYVTNTVVKVVGDSMTGDYWQIITFPIDTWTITNRERVNIMAAAYAIKSTPGVKYVITGYADKQTGSEERNWYLSETRALTVKKVLVEEYGIPAEQLETAFKGGVSNLYFNDLECSRAVVITPVK